MIHHKRRRWALLFLAAALLFSTICIEIGAMTPAHTVTGAYRSSTYHQSLLMIPRTGDKAFDTLAAAMTQVNYHEGNSSADFDGENTSGYKNYTEYNRVIGKVDGTYGYAWCAAFVSWCLLTADAADAAGGTFVSCSLWLDRLRTDGQYSSRASGYKPKAGDLIFFRSAGAGRASDHVGLVRYVAGGRVYTVEGNSSDKVSLNSYALTNTYIVGYGKPDYGTATLESARLYEDTAIGFYAVTNDFVNLRTGAGTDHAKAGKLYKGDVVRILEIQNGWGRLEQGGKTLYISLDYADFISPSAHRITYEAGEGENAPDSTRYFSIKATQVSKQTPTRADHRFLDWQGSDGKIYQGGDLLPVADLTLTARWEPLPVTEPEPPADTPDAPTEDPPEAAPEPPATEDGSGTADDLLTPPSDPPALDPPQSGDTPDRNEASSFSAPDLATAIVLTAAAIGVVLYLVWRKKRKTV